MNRRNQIMRKDDIFEDGVDNRTKAKKFYDENKTAIWLTAAGVALVALTGKRKANRLKAKGDQARMQICYDTGYAEGQRDAYRDVAKSRNHGYRKDKRSAN